MGIKLTDIDNPKLRERIQDQIDQEERAKGAHKPVGGLDDPERQHREVPRYRHWSIVRKHGQDAKAAWLSSLRSSQSAVAGVMRIISSLAPNHCATQSQGHLLSTMATDGSNGNIEPSKPEATPEPKC
jgi:hypothetical protein